MTDFKNIKAFLLRNNRVNSGIALAILRGEADPYARSTLPGHITGSAFVIDPVQRTTLLIHHAGLNKWVQPGGHVDPGETALDAALRETQEETGISGLLLSEGIFDVDIHPIPASERKREPAHYHLDVRYLVSADSSAAVQISPDESHGFQWISLDQLASDDSNVGRMARLALEWLER